MIRNLLSRLFWGGRHEARRENAPATRATRAAITKKTYRSLDEVPPHLRARAEELMAQAHAQAAQQGWASASATTATYQFTGDDGVTHTYNSLEEMPAELRARFEALRSPGEQ